MGLFDGIGRTFDRTQRSIEASRKQQEQAEEQRKQIGNAKPGPVDLSSVMMPPQMQTSMPAPAQKPAPTGLLNPGFVGGADYMQQSTNVYDGSPAMQGQMIDMMRMFGQSTRTTEQH